MKFEIWVEGFLVSGMEGAPEPAKKLGEIEAETFSDACVLLCSGSSFAKDLFNPDRLTIWGCRLFDNESDARKCFG